MVLCFGSLTKTVLIEVLAQCQVLFSFSHHPTSEGAGDAQEVVGRHGWDSRPQVTEGIFHTIWNHAQYVKLGKKEEVRDIWNNSVCIPKSPLQMVGPGFPGDG